MAHYMRWSKHGTVSPEVPLIMVGHAPHERLLAKTVREGACLTYTGFLNNGYPTAMIGWAIGSSMRLSSDRFRRVTRLTIYARTRDV